MKRRSFLAMCVIALLISANVNLQTAIAKDKDGKDDVVGTIWSYTLTNKNKKESGQFRLYNLEIFKGAKKVGYGIRKDDDEAKLIVKNYPPLNGTAVMRKVGRKPPIWKGTLIKEDGSKWQMESTVKDE
jgi:hypothetical protein